ncbi:hypothetical protein [Mesorhizobium sp. M0195]|uniref:hypothetical protein n=1 Tax=Mesorhizobium sp. M0195 TaxID=2956910 RepID=UPI0033386CD8
MGAMSAFAAAMQRAGGPSANEAEFSVAIAKFQNNGGSYERALALLAGAYETSGSGHLEDADKGHAISARAAHSYDDEAGQLNFADKAIEAMPASSSPESSGPGLVGGAEKAVQKLPGSAAPQGNGADHVSCADKANIQLPRPVSPSYLASAKAGSRLVAMTILDSFKVRDGRPIGDVPWSSLDRLIAADRHSAAFLTLIRDRGVPADRNAPIRQLVSVAEAQRLLQQAAEMIDAH